MCFDFQKNLLNTKCVLVLKKVTEHKICFDFKKVTEHKMRALIFKKK